MQKIIIVGGGPAGLFAAYLLLKKNYQVDLYDHSGGLGKKFLIAGNGGLNLTHSEDLITFAEKYTDNKKLFLELLSEFTPNDLREFCKELGIETFVGTSGRVFPKDLKASKLLLSWIKILKNNPNFRLYLKHSLIDITAEKVLTFKTNREEVEIQGDKVILAIGGASWAKTGSNGKWIKLLSKIGIELEELKPMNCGFEASWTDYLIKKLHRSHLKNIELIIGSNRVRGEVMITPYGIEGGAVYALSKFIRKEIEINGFATISIDLKPNNTLIEVQEKIKKKKVKDSISNHLRKSLKLNKTSLTLLNECSQEITAKMIKELPIRLERARPINEAISTSGGVKFSGLSSFFESKSITGLYFAGEMLDFDAPTGGYLLQGCFSTANRVVRGILEGN
ncbi:TIGR03862 family flavoprotein [Bacteriovoracaceae bacterium]|nr:TIGR03862 family flavoprotein [Bacteriovoracaceae bacterium]